MATNALYIAMTCVDPKAEVLKTWPKAVCVIGDNIIGKYEVRVRVGEMTHVILGHTEDSAWRHAYEGILKLQKDDIRGQPILSTEMETVKSK